MVKINILLLGKLRENNILFYKYVRITNKNWFKWKVFFLKIFYLKGIKEIFKNECRHKGISKMASNMWCKINIS